MKIITFVLVLLFATTALAQNQPGPETSIPMASMDAMGGKTAWDNTEFVAWQFVGRHHLWNKFTGDYRMQSGENIVLMNLNTKEGRVWIEGVELTETEAVEKWLVDAYGMWANDSYWLAMPFKLFDEGLTKQYLGVRKTKLDADAEVVQVTFEGVGHTPDNKYHVYFDQETKLVLQWDYYANATDNEPGFALAWTDWKSYGDLQLSTGRESERVTLGYIQVPETVSGDAFTSINGWKVPED